MAAEAFEITSSIALFVDDAVAVVFRFDFFVGGRLSDCSSTSAYYNSFHKLFTNKQMSTY